MLIVIHQAKLLEFFNVMIEIRYGRFVAAGAFDIQFTQTVDNKSCVCGFINNGEKLENDLFEGIEIGIPLE